jgi:integrase
MSNRKVSLLWYCRSPRGWRRFPVVMGRNNRIRHTFVMDKGVEMSYPDGRYELLTYKGRKPVYERAGNNAADALALQKRKSHLMVAKDSAVAAGATLVEEEQRKSIRKSADLYVQDCKNRNAIEAAMQSKLVTSEFIETCRKTFVDEVGKDDIYRFHKALEERGCGDRTRANKHARLKSFLRFAGVDTKELMPPAPKYEITLPTIYTHGEIRAIRQAANDYMKLVIEIGLTLGLRDQEIMYAEWGDLDWQHSTYRVRSKKHWNFKVKDSEQLDIPCTADLMAMLMARHESFPKSRLIVPTAADRPNAKMLRALKRFARRAGLNCGECEGCLGKNKECRNWTLHKLRRTYCTTLLRNNFDLKTVQVLMGHEDLASTMRYLRGASTEETQARINAVKFS